jgi:hypothetical protein
MLWTCRMLYFESSLEDFHAMLDQLELNLPVPYLKYCAVRVEWHNSVVNLLYFVVRVEFRGFPHHDGPSLAQLTSTGTLPPLPVPYPP